MSSASRNRPRVVVVGIGNLLLKDEGIGVHVAQALERISLSNDFEVIDGGTSPDILPLLEGVDKLIIVDAAQGGGQPGDIYRFTIDRLSLEDSISTSVHQIGLMETLMMTMALGIAPEETVIIGVEPKEIDWGLDLSPELENKIPEIIAMVHEELAANR